MSNLKPLVWSRIDADAISGFYCADTDSYITDAVSFCSTLVTDYVIRFDDVLKKYEVTYGGRTKRYECTLDAAERWAEHKHYASKMRAYVQPSPTWVDVDKRLPDSEYFYLVRLFDGHRDDYVTVILWWNSEHKQFLEWDAMCEPTHWMPIPEFSTMKNLHNASEVMK